MSDDVEGWDCSDYKEFSDSETSNISYADEEPDTSYFEKPSKKKKKKKKKDIEGESISSSKKIQYSSILQEETDYRPE